MKAITTLALLFALFPGHSSLRAAELGLAEGLTAAGIANAAKGNVAQAKDLFMKALSRDDTCPDALFELAKIVDKEGDASSAGDLFQHAAQAYAQEAKPANALKRAEADKRARALNPTAAKLTVALEDYATDLDKIVKKINDAVTESTALDRINDLQLTNAVAPEKLPKFYAVAQAAKKKEVAAAAKMNEPKAPPNDNGGPLKKRRVAENPKQEGVTAPEVEKELKALGWTSVVGMWVKKGPGVYEATDAKLEAPKINGVIDFWVVKGGDGTVKAMVRSDPKNASSGFGGFGGGQGGGKEGGDGPSESDMTGYGTFYRGKDFKNYGYGERFGKGKKGGGPGGGFGGGFGITHLITTSINESNAKNHFQIKIDENSLDFYYNGTPTKYPANIKMSHTGNFVLDVNGTITVEAPRCTGQ